MFSLAIDIRLSKFSITYLCDYVTGVFECIYKDDEMLLREIIEDRYFTISSRGKCFSLLNEVEAINRINSVFFKAFHIYHLIFSVRFGIFFLFRKEEIYKLDKLNF